MKWIKERDDLIAQTKAFVQSVAGRKPQGVAEPAFAEPKFIETSAAAAPSGPISASLPIDDFTVVPPPVEPIQPALPRPPVAATLEGDVRKEIQNRVAVFRAHQHRFHREREAYFNSVLTKARSGGETGSDVSSS